MQDFFNGSTRIVAGLLFLLFTAHIAFGQSAATVQVEVRSDTGPVDDAQVVAGGKTYETDSKGIVVLPLPPGIVDLAVVKPGFVPTSASVTVQAGQRQSVIIELTREVTVEEHVTVSATRTDRGIEDQPIRV